MANISWTCPMFGCKHPMEKTSPNVKSVVHLHNGKEYSLIPYKKPRTTPGTETVRELDKKLWPIFSEYIRRGYSDDKGYCTCVTCGKKDHWKNMQAGHFISRAKKAIKYDVRNVHCQCPMCNGFKHGNAVEYRKFMLERYGEKTVLQLEYLSRRIYSFKIYELKHLIELYKRKLSGVG
ncbi:MAG TPA: hypothetical protein ENN95_02465 [Deltaproteobacteria bacterium]|nr:hypothetical protein [Deltaproteobacteria bacterium]